MKEELLEVGAAEGDIPSLKQPSGQGVCPEPRVRTKGGPVTHAAVFRDTTQLAHTAPVTQPHGHEGPNCYTSFLQPSM